MTHYLVDVSWMLYRGYYALSNVWQEYPELHFLAKKIESWLSGTNNTVYLCLDGYNIKGKRLLGENYKAGRHQENGYNVYCGLATFVRLLNNDRIKILYGRNYESDEIIFTLSRTLNGRKKIVSGDKDIFQSLTKDVVIDNGKDYVITEESYKFEYADKFFEIDPPRLPIYRAIVGDPSDSLKPPVARFPHKLAAKLSKEISYNGTCPSVDDINSIKNICSGTEIKWIDRLIESYNPFSINFDIMKLNVIPDNELHDDYNYPEVPFSEFLTSKIVKLNEL